MINHCGTNIFLANLAVADLLVIIVCTPFTLVAHLINRDRAYYYLLFFCCFSL